MLYFNHSHRRSVWPLRGPIDRYCNGTGRRALRQLLSATWGGRNARTRRTMERWNETASAICAPRSAAHVPGRREHRTDPRDVERPAGAQSEHWLALPASYWGMEGIYARIRQGDGELRGAITDRESDREIGLINVSGMQGAAMQASANAERQSPLAQLD